MAAAIDMANLTPAERLHEPRQRNGVRRGQEKMNMIGHQNLSMHQHASGARGFRQAVQIKPPVRVFKEDRHAVVAALNDVMRLASRQQPAPSTLPRQRTYQERHKG